MNRFVLTFCCSILTVGAASAPAQTLSPECQAMFDAGQKQFTVPSHAFMTMTGMGPAGTQSEMINVDGATYAMVNGTWMKSPVSVAQLIEQSKAQIASAKSHTCQKAADETVDGVAASVYTAHTETPTGVTDSRVWVGKDTGLPLKSEIDMTMGARKSHTSVRYEYKNVTAPPGVK
jgi:outer membrane lipoprotein-sorting protein